MRKIIVIGCIALLFAGCASIKQAKNDAQVGYTAPLAQGEVAPLVEATPIAATATGALVAAIPIAAPFSIPIQGAIASAVGLFFAWQRGRNIRKNQTPSTNPITGFLGNQTGLEAAIQSIATVASGVTEFFKEGSSAQHAWQGILTGLAGVAGAALAVPQVGAIVASHPEIYAWVGGIAGAANALQQALTQVKPIQTIPTA